MSNFSEKDVASLVEILDGPIVKDIQMKFEKRLMKCGIMYRVFSRVKSYESIREKLERKWDKYIHEDKKMQDSIGFRIVLYFRDDVDICISLLKKIFIVDNCEHDQPDSETFGPQRINYVFKIPDDVEYIPSDLLKKLRIDDTFEIQIRTIFSEGWHEVDHDVRYKYKRDWIDENAISRELNGILAVLEVCDNNILSICDEMAYKKYKNREWEAMIRHKFRLRLKHDSLDGDIISILNSNSTIAKKLYRFDRQILIDFLSIHSIPLICNNIVYIANELEMNDENIKQLVPNRIHELCGEYLNEIKRRAARDADVDAE